MEKVVFHEPLALAVMPVAMVTSPSVTVMPLSLGANPDPETVAVSPGPAWFLFRVMPGLTENGA